MDLIKACALDPLSHTDTTPIPLLIQGQQVFHLPQPLDLQRGDKIEGTMAMVRQKDNPRLYEVHVSFYVVGDGGQASEYVSHKYLMP